MKERKKIRQVLECAGPPALWRIAQ